VSFRARRLKYAAKNPRCFLRYERHLIYCDLIVPQFVGHSKVRCLRTFILPTTFCNEVVQPTAFCNEVFENLYYVPVEKRAFRDITILIIDTVGNPIAFPDRKTPAKVVLHFRRFIQ